MANKHTTLDSLFTDIADQLRAKKNTSGVIVADDFPDEIESLETVSDLYSRLKTETKKGNSVNITDVMVLGVLVQPTISSNPVIVSLPTSETGSEKYTSDGCDLTITRNSVIGTLPTIASLVHVTYAEI